MNLPAMSASRNQRTGVRGKGIRRLFCALVVGWLLASCLQLDRPLPTQTPPTPLTASETSLLITLTPDQPASSTPPTVSSPTAFALQTTPLDPTPTPQVLPHNNYHIKVQFDYSRHYLQVQEQVSYTHAAPEEISELVFLVEPNRYPDSFLMNQIHWSDGTPLENALKGNRLTVTLPRPLEYGGTVALTISYELNLPEIPPPSEESHPQPYGYTSRQTNLVDWYPVLPPYQPGKGWLAHAPGYFGEHQVYQSADYQVEIEVAGWQSTGQPMQIAASAPTEHDGNLYRYKVQNARNFAWSASPVYVVSTRQVGEISVSSYAFPYSNEGGEAALQATADALRLYSRLYGPYPQRSLSIIEADFLDGMEYEGLFFLSRGFYNLYDGTPAGYLTAIAAHETAHQWWYGLVGNDQALEPWLDEALCTYSEKLFYEYNYPELLDWWWDFRVNYFQPQGAVNGTIYDYNGFLTYRNAVYLRGAQFLEALRQAVGDEAFFAFLKDYASQYAHRLATADDFFAILNAHFPANIKPLLQEYFK